MQRIATAPRLPLTTIGFSAVPRPSARWWASVLLLLGLMLRVALLARPGLHPDEALYASWALRIADGSDPALLSVYVDKPPLFLYLLAGLLRITGVTGAGPVAYAGLEGLLRLPALVASVASLGLVYAIARRVYGMRVALLALALVAVSPLAVRLSPSVFTDPLLVLWMLLGMWAALQHRSWSTGIACGLAYATKQQAVLLIPLVVAVFWWAENRWRGAAGGQATRHASRTTHQVSPRRAAWRLFNGFALVAALVLWWDSLRWQWMPSYWDRSLTTYGGVGLAPAASLLERLEKWGELISYVFGSPLLTIGLILGLPLSSWIATRRLVFRHPANDRQGVNTGPGLPRERHDCAAVAAFDLLLLAFVLAYLALHLAMFAPWDRYALPLVPVLALLLARAAVHVLERWPQSASARLANAGRRAVIILGLVAMLQAAWLGVLSPLPVGDVRAYDGVGPLARYLRASQPPDTVLYHHWLGWHYAFYLHDSRLDLRWWESPADLATQAKAARSQAPQLIAFPAGRDQTTVRQALRAAGLRLVPVWQHRHPDGTVSLTLYRLAPQPGRDHGYVERS